MNGVTLMGLIDDLRSLSARRSAAVETAMLGTDKQKTDNAAYEVFCIDRSIIRVALRIASADDPA